MHYRKYRLRLLWGKLRRQFLIIFRPRYVGAMRLRRIGACRNCGICCQLGWGCWFHRGLEMETEGGCSRYEMRPSTCRLFPIDQRDLRDRNLLLPHTPCGYSFVTVEEVEEILMGPAPALAVESAHGLSAGHCRAATRKQD